MSEDKLLPEGWVLVPRNVTDNMYVAFRDEIEGVGPMRRFVEAYGAMISAAPPAPVPTADVLEQDTTINTKVA